jgi:hypothetical protein
MGRSGGVQSGRWWEIANRADGFFQIGVERSGQFVINPNGNVSIPADLSVGTISAGNTAIGTFQNLDNRLLFRDGAGALNVGGCSFWSYTNTSVAWTTGISITNAFYVPSTTATIQIQITGSGYTSSAPIGTEFRFGAFDAVNFAYQSFLPFFFNLSSVHTQVTQHITIPPNYWGVNTIGYKRIFVEWAPFVLSDVNDTIQYSVSVIG